MRERAGLRLLGGVCCVFVLLLVLCAIVGTQHSGERASLRIPSDPFLPVFPLMWRGVRGSSYRGGGLPLLTPSRNDNTTSPPPPSPCVCVCYVCTLFLSYVCGRSLKSVRGTFFQRKGEVRAWRGRTDVIFGSLGCVYTRESGSSDRCLKMGAP